MSGKFPSMLVKLVPPSVLSQTLVTPKLERVTSTLFVLKGSTSMEEIYEPLVAGIIVITDTAGVALALVILITSGGSPLTEDSTVEAPIQIVLAATGSILTAVNA